jgi:hypothetical protein
MADRQFKNRRRKAQRKTRQSQYGFIVVVSLWSFLSIGNPGYTHAFHSSSQGKSVVHKTRLFSSHSNNGESRARNARRRFNGFTNSSIQQKTKPIPVTGYDAKTIEQYYDRRPLQVGWRLNSLGFPLLGWYLGLLMDNASGVSEKPEVQRKRGQELRELLVQSRSVALIKVSVPTFLAFYHLSPLNLIFHLNLI